MFGDILRVGSKQWELRTMRKPKLFTRHPTLKAAMLAAGEDR